MKRSLWGLLVACAALAAWSSAALAYNVNYPGVEHLHSRPALTG